MLDARPEDGIGVSKVDAKNSTKNLNDVEKEALSRLRESPLKFRTPSDAEILKAFEAAKKGDSLNSELIYVSAKSESTQKRDSRNPKRIEVGISDGFDFGDKS